MRTISSSGRHHYLKRAGMFLIAVALIAGIVSCAGDEVGPYDLTMAADPAEGGTATDETNESPYEEGAAVSIKAVAAEGYEFDGWTAPEGEFADASAKETIFKMPARDVIVTGKFRPRPTPLDHFKGYGLDPATKPSAWPYVGETVELEDQFVSITATVGLCTAFSNPVEKKHDGVLGSILDRNHHLMSFTLEDVEPQWWRVTVTNQFGKQELTVAGPIALAVPTLKEPYGDPEGLDYFLFYEVIDPPSVEVVVDLSDQFGDEQNVLVTQAKAFGNPVRVKHGREVKEIVNPHTHLVSYWTWVKGASTEQHEVDVSNQFGQYHLTVLQGEEGVLTVPSEKLDSEQVEPPLNHFRCYNVGGGTMPYVGETVELEDQFHKFGINAMVGWGSTLCNPVEKATQEVAAWEWVPISDADHHLMLYTLEDVEEQEWVVEVKNQFGEQKWTVRGPGGLAVPTQKEGHDPPVGLDHLLCYEVIGGTSMNVVVDLYDQFGYGDNVLVLEPFAFANPVRKTHDGEVTEIVDPDEHLVFYRVLDEDWSQVLHTVEVSNQFGSYNLTVFQGQEAALAVPSEKINWYAS